MLGSLQAARHWPLQLRLSQKKAHLRRPDRLVDGCVRRSEQDRLHSSSLSMQSLHDEVWGHRSLQRWERQHRRMRHHDRQAGVHETQHELLQAQHRDVVGAVAVIGAEAALVGEEAMQSVARVWIEH